MSKHTKGPWKVYAGNTVPMFIGASDFPYKSVKFIAEVGKNNRHNANLISAAPEMLERVKELRDMLLDAIPDQHSEEADWLKDEVASVNALIKKAEGS